MRFWQKLTFILGIFFVYLIPTTDTDFGWHLRCGQDWLNTGQFCFNNRYSYFLPDYFWTYSTWLYDLGLAFIYNLAGFLGTGIALGILMATLAWLFIRRFKKSQTVIFSFMLFLLLSNQVIKVGFRPQILALVLLTLFLNILFSLVKKDKSQFWLKQGALSLLIIIWVNLHPSFIIAPAIYSLFALTKFYQRDLRYVLSLLLIWLSTLLSPLGYLVYQELLNHSTTQLNTLIAEWTAPAAWLRWLIILTLALSSYLTIKNKQLFEPKTWFFLSCLYLLAFLSFSAKRHLPLYSLYLAFYWEEEGISKTIFKATKIPIRLLTLSSLLLICVFAFKNSQEQFYISDWQTNYCYKALVKQPCQISQSLPNFQGNLFTMYEWGGYLIWQLPKAKVFVDGRMPAWQTKSGKSPYTIYLEIIQARPGWEQTLARLNTQALLIQPGTFLDLELQKNDYPNWQQLERNQRFVIYRTVK